MKNMSAKYVYLVFQVMPFDDYHHEFEGAFTSEELAENYKRYLIDLETKKHPDYDYPFWQDFYVSKVMLNRTESY
jgi:hypothetical protein